MYDYQKPMAPGYTCVKEGSSVIESHLGQAQKRVTDVEKVNNKSVFSLHVKFAVCHID